MKTTIENVQFYLDLLNKQGTVKLYLRRGNGTNYIAKKQGNESIYNGTLTDCYYFLVGAQKLVNPLFNDYTVNGTFRTFMIVDSHCGNYFCNLQSLSKIVDNNSLKAGYYTIYHFWNNKPKKVSKKYLSELFAANGLKLDFIY